MIQPPKKILIVLGTRPEIIKLITVILALKANPMTAPIVCVTGQHREMLDQMLQLSNITPDIDLNLMRPNQTLGEITTAVLAAMPAIFEQHQPDIVLVQGDTTSVFAAALAAFYSHIPVAHIEAGLRSFDMTQPYPEEFNRRSVSLFASHHFAPTKQSSAYLEAEHIAPETIHMVGNTVIDALHYYRDMLAANLALKQQIATDLAFLDASKKLILVTSHRRENHDGGIARICDALRQLAKRDDVQIVLPVHPNPNVHTIIHKNLADIANIHLTQPQDYLHFLELMTRAHLIISDSGGVQEEAPSLQKPVLVLREATERPEGIQAGVTKLVGTNSQKIIAEATILLDNPSAYQAMQGHPTLYGDGTTSQKITNILAASL